MKILVCDDLPTRGKEIVDAIFDTQLEGINVTKLFKDPLKEELGKLFRNVAALIGPSENLDVLEPTEFDVADIVIIDNNLAHLDIEGTRLTAESVAGYVRAFTAAPYVVSLNKNPDVDFDLRYLVGDYATRADLAVNTSHLSNPALWTGEKEKAKGGFLPWYWPVLKEVPDRRRTQIEFVTDHLQDRVLEILCFPPEVVGNLSRHAMGALSPDAGADDAGKADGVSPSEVTFQNFFMASRRSIPDRAERKQLSDEADAGNGKAREVIARVVAADLDFWFRRDVLGPQEVLVDIPHLLMRMPFLLGDGAKEVNKWNEIIEADYTPPFGIDDKMFERHVVGTKFKYDIWLQSPSFWWPILKTDEKLNDLFFTPDSDWADAVFCEDSSTFLARTPADDSAAPTEFAAEFEGSWNRRHVARLDGIRYAPRSRFAH